MSVQHAGLLKRAMSAPETTTLEDAARGLRAEVEVSGDGGSRAVQILEGDAVIWSSVAYRPGVPKPDFYPADVPFLPAVSGTVSGDFAAWTFESEGAFAGIEAIRRSARDLVDRRPELAGKVEELASAARSARGTGAARELFQSFLNDLGEDLGAAIHGLGRELAAAAEDAGPGIESVVEEILAFYRARGWRIAEAETGGATRRHLIEKDERSLTLTAMAGPGVPTVTLMGRRSPRSPHS